MRRARLVLYWPDVHATRASDWDAALARRPVTAYSPSASNSACNRSATSSAECRDVNELSRSRTSPAIRRPRSQIAPVRQPGQRLSKAPDDYYCLMRAAYLSPKWYDATAVSSSPGLPPLLHGRALAVARRCARADPQRARHSRAGVPRNGVSGGRAGAEDGESDHARADGEHREALRGAGGEARGHP